MEDEPLNLDVTFEKISGAIGSLMLVWAAIERSARDEVVRVYGGMPKKAHGIAAVLRTLERTVVKTHPLRFCDYLSSEMGPPWKQGHRQS